MNSENKHKLLALFCLLGALILGTTSSLITAKLFLSFDNTWFKFVLVFVGISMDFGKFGFPAVAMIQLNKNNFASAIACFALAMCCIAVSFFASMAYDLNKGNEIANETITDSGAYQRQDEIFKTTSATIATIKSDLAELKANRGKNEDKIRADFSPLLATAKRLNMLTENKDSVAEITKRRDAKIAALDDSIKAKEAELLQKEKSLTGVNETFAQIGTQIKTTRGVYALASWFNPANPEKTMGTINFIKNILIEIIAIAFSMAFGALVSGENVKPSESGKILPFPTIFKKATQMEATKKEGVVNLARSDTPSTKLESGSSEKINDFVPDGFTEKVIKGFQIDRSPTPEIQLNSAALKAVNEDKSINSEQREMLKKYIKAMMMKVDPAGYVDGTAKIAARAGLSLHQGNCCRATLVNMKHPICEIVEGRTKLIR